MRNISNIQDVRSYSTREVISALSQRNKQQLFEVLRAAQPIIEEMVEVKPSTWRQMRGFFSSMEQVGRLGLTAGIQQAGMMPFRLASGRLGFMMEGMMMPMMPMVNKITNAYQSLVMANQTGAMYGSMAGMAVGSMWGPMGAQAGALAGGLLGGLLEKISGSVGTISPHEDPNHPENFHMYYMETGRWPSRGTADADYLRWFYARYYGTTASDGTTDVTPDIIAGPRPPGPSRPVMR